MDSCHYIILLFLIFSLNFRESSTMNTFDIRDECNTVRRYVAIVLFSLLVLYGIVSNILMGIVFFRGRGSLYSRAFFLITYQLIICSFLNFLPQVIIVLHEILQNKTSDAYKITWSHNIFATMNTFSFFATLHFTFLLTVNRFVAINLPNFNAFFASVKFYFVIAFVWLSALGMIH
uniref:G_PROTEIN_RECEP_F1_2 domain-containing protein n=1 Tax=Elaeophora elaphi TaxID=1147741 RepID=A0A0R3RNJ5_9BILA